MRLVACDVDPAEAQIALGDLKAPGASVLLNPAYMKLDPDAGIYLALGSAAVKMMQGAGYIPKKGGVEALRGRVFPYADEALGQFHFGVSYDPSVRFIDYGKFVDLQCDISLYTRFDQTGSIAPLLGDYGYAEDLSGVIAYVTAYLNAGHQFCEVAVDLETMGLHPWYPDKHIVSVSVTAKEGIADVIYTLGMPDDQLYKLRNDLQWLLAHPRVKVIGANLKFDMLWLRVKWGIVVDSFTFDTCNGGALLEENRSNTLNVHTKVYTPDLGGYDDHFNQTHDKSRMDLVPPEDLLPYAGGDTDACLRNYRAIRKGLLADNLGANGKPAKNSLPSLYINIVHPALKALHKAEWHGVCVDVERFHEFGADLEGRMQETMQKAALEIPKVILNAHGGLGDGGTAPLSKPKMIADFLFSPNGLNLKPTQTTAKTGAASTSHYHLSQFKDHPEAGRLIQLYLDYKAVSKMHGTYYKGFLNHLRPDNRWHATYIIHKSGQRRGEEQGGGTVTGRGSAVDPAFQCVTGESLILTDQGVKRADELIDPVVTQPERYPLAKPPEGFPKLWAQDGWRDVSCLFKSWRHDLLTVMTDDCRALTCTPEHPFYVRKRGWVKAKDLQFDDEVQLQKPAPILPGPVDTDLAYFIGTLKALGRAEAFAGGVMVHLPPEGMAQAVEALSSLPDMGCTVEEDYIVWTTDTMTDWGAAALSYLHEPGYPQDFLCTTSGLAFMQAILNALMETSNFGWVAQLRVRHHDPELLRGMQLETVYRGFVAPTAKSDKDGFYMEWIGNSAARILYECSIMVPDEKGWSPVPTSNYYQRPHPKNKIVAVTEAEPAYVYDFTVPDGHAFLANGYLVHNTVPKHSYWGKRLRECIIAPDGYRIAGIDYSQGELKVAACWAQEMQMIKAYLDGIDLHALTAATVNGMSYEEAMHLKQVDKDAYGALRQKGKAGNFGLLYGMSAYGFMMYADQVYGVTLTLEEAEAMRDTFFSLYPGLTVWHDKQITEARVTGQVRSPLGRVRRLYNINASNKEERKRAENQAINSPIQGTLGDMMWWAMGLIEEQHKNLIIPFGNVHDQGLWYVREDTWKEDTLACKEIMENLPFEEKFGWKPELAFTVDAEVGSNLANLEGVKFA